MIQPWQGFVGAAVLVAIAAGGYVWWQRQQQALVPPAQPAVEQPVPQAQAPEPVPAAPAIQHPIETAPAASAPARMAVQPLPPLASADAYVKDALAALLGRPALLSFVQADDFARRVVVTVDNLPRDHASPRLWPVNPIEGRFSTDQRDGSEWLGARNANRYAAFLRFVESVDAQQAVATYVQMYPLFQQAYEELGYPGRYFNDRLVEVIDHLLQTPALTGPVELHLTDVKGPYKLEKPWVGYQFANPAFESRSAGQKMMLRAGSANALRLKAKLTEIRRLVTRAPVGASAAPASR